MKKQYIRIKIKPDCLDCEHLKNGRKDNSMCGFCIDYSYFLPKDEILKFKKYHEGEVRTY